jgi:hypothetical protein
MSAHKVNETNLRCRLDMIDEVKEAVHIQEFAAKQRAERCYNSKAIPRDMNEPDLVLIGTIFLLKKAIFFYFSS